MQGGVRRERDLVNAPPERDPEEEPDQASLVRKI